MALVFAVAVVAAAAVAVTVAVSEGCHLDSHHPSHLLMGHLILHWQLVKERYWLRVDEMHQQPVMAMGVLYLVFVGLVGSVQSRDVENQVRSHHLQVKQMSKKQLRNT